MLFSFWQNLWLGELWGTMSESAVSKLVSLMSFQMHQPKPHTTPRGPLLSIFIIVNMHTAISQHQHSSAHGLFSCVNINGLYWRWCWLQKQAPAAPGRHSAQAAIQKKHFDVVSFSQAARKLLQNISMPICTHPSLTCHFCLWRESELTEHSGNLARDHKRCSFDY